MVFCTYGAMAFAANPDADLRRVACLTASRQDELKEAIEILGVRRLSAAGKVVIGREQLSPPSWSRRYPSEFDRVCTAMIHAEQSRLSAGVSGKQASWLGDVGKVLLPLLMGAALAFWATVGQERRATRKNVAAELRTSAARLVGQGVTLLERFDDAPGAGRPSALEFTQAKMALSTAWNRAGAFARVKGPKAVVAGHGWENAYQRLWQRNRIGTTMERDKLESWLNAVDRDTEALAHAVERGKLRHLRLYPRWRAHMRTTC